MERGSNTLIFNIWARGEQTRAGDQFVVGLTSLMSSLKFRPHVESIWGLSS